MITRSMSSQTYVYDTLTMLDIHQNNFFVEEEERRYVLNICQRVDNIVSTKDKYSNLLPTLVVKLRELSDDRLMCTFSKFRSLCEKYNVLIK